MNLRWQLKLKRYVMVDTVHISSFNCKILDTTIGG